MSFTDFLNKLVRNEVSSIEIETYLTLLDNEIEKELAIKENSEIPLINRTISRYRLDELQIKKKAILNVFQSKNWKEPQEVKDGE